MIQIHSITLNVDLDEGEKARYMEIVKDCPKGFKPISILEFVVLGTKHKLGMQDIKHEIIDCEMKNGKGFIEFQLIVGEQKPKEIVHKVKNTAIIRNLHAEA